MSDTYFATIINLIVNLWERFAKASFNLVASSPHLKTNKTHIMIA